MYRSKLLKGYMLFQRGRILMTGLITILMIGVIGCQTLTDDSSPSHAGTVGAVVASAENDQADAGATAQAPKFSTTDDSGSRFDVYSVRPVRDQVEISFTYTTTEGTSARRIALLAQDGSKLMVQDGAYSLLTGMKVSQDESKVSLRLYATQTSILQVERYPNDDDLIYVMLGSMEKSQTVDFPGIETLDSAVSVYENVQAGVVARGDLDETDSELLSRAETISAWDQYLDDSFAGSDIAATTALIRNPEFRAWASSDLNGAPTLDIPDIMNLVCRVVPVFKFVCNLIGGGQVCEWIRVLEMICEILREYDVIK